jgi:tRNA dimethylallyltransferase
MPGSQGNEEEGLSRMGLSRAVLIAGPTASGKSAMALRMAAERGGVVVNADALQVYDVLRVLTARPSEADTARVPHHLYGFVPPAERFSTGAYLRAARDLVENLDPAIEPIFVGGTGLYFEALINGVADIPPVPRAILDEVQQEIKALDGAGRLRLLQAEDPETAARLGVADPQRLVRAIAVKRATGVTLSAHLAGQPAGPLAGFTLEKLVLEPPRALVRERIAARFAAMFENGAVAEVERLLALNLDPSLPAMKAIGVREIAAWLAGEIDRDTAIANAVTATQQYAKRQGTWLRNRMGDWRRVEP